MITLKMKSLALIAMTLILSVGMFAQKGDTDRKERKEMIQAKKVAYCTEKAGLTEKESEKYWSLRNDLDEKKKDLKEDTKQLKDIDLDTASDDVIREALQTGMENKVSANQLELDYLPTFLEVVSAKKLALIKLAERDFKREVLKDLKGRDKGERPSKQEIMERNSREK